MILEKLATLEKPSGKTLRARIQSCIEANSNAQTPVSDPNEKKFPSSMICSLDTQQREFVERRMLQEKDQAAFFGLPKKVADLLKELRGIQNIYGETRQAMSKDHHHCSLNHLLYSAASLCFRLAEGMFRITRGERRPKPYLFAADQRRKDSGC